MASSLALKRLLSSSIVPRSRSVLRPAISSRLFNTNAVRSYDDDGGVDFDRRSDRSVPRRRDDFFSGTHSLAHYLYSFKFRPDLYLSRVHGAKIVTESETELKI